MTIASILSDFWKGGGGAFEAPLQAQELQKSPDGIGLKHRFQFTLIRRLLREEGLHFAMIAATCFATILSNSGNVTCCNSSSARLRIAVPRPIVQIQLQRLMCQPISTASILPGHLRKICQMPGPAECGQFSLADAPPPVPTMMVKRPAPQFIRPIHDIRYMRRT